MGKGGRGERRGKGARRSGSEQGAPKAPGEGSSLLRTKIGETLGQGDEEEVRNKTRTTRAKQEQHTANKEDDGAEPATAYRAGFAGKREHKDGKKRIGWNRTQLGR